jgi:UrcA family protein
MRKFITSLTTAATLSLAVVPALGLLQAAHAAEAAEPTATISLIGLNLANPAHAAEFAGRVEVAGEQVCREMVHGNPGGNFTIAGCKVAVRKQVSQQLSKTQRQNLQMAMRASPIAIAAR